MQKDVRAWLKRLQLYEYTELFEQEGYSTADDIENLKDLKENDLRAMGVSKRGMHSLDIWFRRFILHGITDTLMA